MEFIIGVVIGAGAVWAYQAWQRKQKKAEKSKDMDFGVE